MEFCFNEIEYNMKGYIFLTFTAIVMNRYWNLWISLSKRISIAVLIPVVDSFWFNLGIWHLSFASAIYNQKLIKLQKIYETQHVVWWFTSIISNFFVHKIHLGYQTRRLAVDTNVPLLTDVKLAKLLIEALYRYFHGQNANKTVIKSEDNEYNVYKQSFLHRLLPLHSITSSQIIYLPGLIDIHVHTR